MKKTRVPLLDAVKDEILWFCCGKNVKYPVKFIRYVEEGWCEIVYINSKAFTLVRTHCLERRSTDNV